MLRLFAGVLLLSSCASADAVDFDAGNDVHCYGLSTYFAAAEVKEFERGVTPIQASLYVLVINHWFREKFAEEVVKIGKPAADAQAKSRFETVGADFEKTKQRFKACVARATSDPKFESFARAALKAAESGD